MKPEAIEALSFKIIDGEAGSHAFSERQWNIVRRMIHTSADFEYMQSVVFHPRAIAAGIDALKNGKDLVTDTTMALSGIRKKEMAQWGGGVHCLISTPEVAARAAAQGTTRALAAVDEAVGLIDGGLYVVGNAPTALLRLIELIQTGEAHPALVVGLPVGFVNAAESKAALEELDVPYITNRGRKGGSNVAASVVNALIIMADAGQ